MAQEASYEEAAEAAREWTKAVLECRTLGHSWQQQQAVYVERLYYWRVSYRCIRGCGVTRYEEWDRLGRVIGKATLTYPLDPETGEPAYLTKGIGRIFGDAKGALRLESATRGPNERKRGKIIDADLPRKSSTRQALGMVDDQASSS